MRVRTKPFGEIEADERQIVEFPHGILGFEQLRRFIMLDASQPPFYWLQSMEQQEVAFVLIDPKTFKPDYTPDVSPEDHEDMGLSSMQDALVFAIVTIPEDRALLSANLQGPIVINRRTRTGRQCISTNARWKVKHFILEELAAVRNRAC